MIDSVLRKALEARIASSGFDWVKIVSIELRPEPKTAALTVMLDGEEKPVTINATYALEEGGVRVKSLTTSRRWMTEGLQLALTKSGGLIPLPGGLQGKLVRMFL